MPGSKPARDFRVPLRMENRRGINAARSLRLFQGYIGAGGINGSFEDNPGIIAVDP